MYDTTHNSKERTGPSDGTQALANYAEVQGDFSARDLLQILWRRLWIIVLVTIVLVGTTVGASLSQTPVYEASAKLLLGQKQSKDQVLQPNLMGSVEGLQQLTHTMAEAVASRPVAEEVIQRQGLQMTPEELLNNLTVEQIEDTQFLLLSYRDNDPQRAQTIVNEVSDVSSEQISEANAIASEMNLPVTMMVWEDAAVPDTPINLHPIRDGLLALGIGLMLGMGLVFLLEYFDDSWRSPEEVEQVSRVPTFGVIPEFKVAKTGKRIKP